MAEKLVPPSRRWFLRGMALGTGALILPEFWSVPGALADELTRTPRQIEGPFYRPASDQ